MKLISKTPLSLRRAPGWWAFPFRTSVRLPRRWLRDLDLPPPLSRLLFLHFTRAVPHFELFVPIPMVPCWVMFFARLVQLSFFHSEMLPLPRPAPLSLSLIFLSMDIIKDIPWRAEICYVRFFRFPPGRPQFFRCFSQETPLSPSFLYPRLSRDRFVPVSSASQLIPVSHRDRPARCHLPPFENADFSSRAYGDNLFSPPIVTAFSTQLTLDGLPLLFSMRNGRRQFFR